MLPMMAIFGDKPVLVMAERVHSPGLTLKDNDNDDDDDCDAAKFGVAT